MVIIYLHLQLHVEFKNIQGVAKHNLIWFRFKLPLNHTWKGTSVRFALQSPNIRWTNVGDPFRRPKIGTNNAVPVAVRSTARATDRMRFVKPIFHLWNSKHARRITESREQKSKTSPTDRRRITIRRHTRLPPSPFIFRSSVAAIRRTFPNVLCVVWNRFWICFRRLSVRHVTRFACVQFVGDAGYVLMWC